MAAPKTKITPQRLEELSYIYIKECEDNTTEKLANTGKKVQVKDRHIPTIDYFLRIWIPKQDSFTIARSTFYDWLNLNPEEGDKKYEEHKTKSDTIKKITDLFASLAADIVANEGKGIFYAKNRLGMTDKQALDINTEQPLFGPLDDGG